MLVIGLSTGRGRAMEPASALTFSCHVLGGGYAIEDSDGRILENGDGVPFPPGPATLIRIDRATRRVTVTGAPLPHPDGVAGPEFAGLDPVRFTWGRAAYTIEPDGAAGLALHSLSRSIIGSGPHSGKVMEVFLSGSCASS